MLEIERLAQQVVDQWETGQLAEAVRALAAEQHALRLRRHEGARHVALVKNYYRGASDDVEVDDEPLIDRAEDGYWINVWHKVADNPAQEIEHD